MSSRIGRAGTVGFPDGHGGEGGAGVGLGEGGGEERVEDFGDVFDAGVEAAAGLVEFDGVFVEVGVVEFVQEDFGDEGFEVVELERGCGGEADGGFELVVVAVAFGVVALAEEVAVFGVAEGGDVEAVGGGEVEALAEDGGGGGHGSGHRVFLFFGEAVGGGEVPAELRELDVGRGGFEVGGEGVPGGVEDGGEVGLAGLERGEVGFAREGEDGGADSAVDGFDVEEVAGGLGGAGDAGGELDVGAEALHGGLAGEGVEGQSGVGRGIVAGFGQDGAAHGAREGGHGGVYERGAGTDAGEWGAALGFGIRGETGASGRGVRANYDECGSGLMENAMAFACPLCKFVLPAVSAVALIAVAGVVAQQEGTKDAPKEAPAAETAKVDPYVLGHVVKDIDGKTVDLSAYKGQVVVIVNVASKCGFTKQYTGLESLYQAKKAQGLVILGFPANNFGGQEPGTNAEIKEFCTGAESKYKVTFPLFEKISVKGEDIHPLYKQLATQPAPIGGDVGWNFTKYLVDREGKVVAKFDSRTKPDDAAMNKRIDELLGAAKAAPAEKPAGGS